MDFQSDNNKSLWKCRGSLPKLNVGMSLVLMLLAAGTSGLSVVSAESMLALFFPAAMLAFLMTCERGAVWILTIPLSYLIGFLASGDPVHALLSLIYIPVAVVLAFCVYTEKSLSVTIVALTVTLCVLLGVAAVASGASNGLFDGGLSGITSAVSDQITAGLESLKYTDENGEVFSLMNDQEISVAAETTAMLIPSIMVMLCELLAYVSAKIYRLLSIISSMAFMYRGGVWKMTVGVPTGVLFILSYIVTSLSTGSSVAAYSAANLMYILLIPLAIAGARGMFGRGSRFRVSMGTLGRIAMICICVLAVYASPMMLLVLFAFWSSIDCVARGIKLLVTRKRGE